MLAEAYNDGTMRLFDRNGWMICEMQITEQTEECADKQLRRLKLRRRTKWRVTSWGRKANMRFDR